MSYTPRFKERYDAKIKAEMKNNFGYSNDNEIPKLEKIVINMSVTDAVTDRKAVEKAMEQLALITGQKPVMTRAKKSNASFKLREGMPLGCKVTLRRERMYEFLDRLVTIALPRVRDFRGVSHKSFDGRGNYAMGLKEQIVFQEIQFDKIDKTLGMDIIICTTAKTDNEARELLRAFDLPFQDKREEKK